MAGPDARAYLIEALGENPEQFQLSNLILKNGKGLLAIKEIRSLEAELTGFAKNPEKGIEQLGQPPRRPDPSKYPIDEDRFNADQEWLIQMSVYNMAKMALHEHVPPEDMMTIKKYMKPYHDTLAATPAIKGRRFFSFTKQIQEEPTGLGAMFGRKSQQQG